MFCGVFRIFLTLIFVFHFFTGREFTTMHNELLMYYCNDKTITVDIIKKYIHLTSLAAFFLFLLCSSMTSLLHSADNQQEKPVFVYLFQYSQNNANVPKIGKFKSSIIEHRQTTSYDISYNIQQTLRTLDTPIKIHHGHTLL